MKYVFCIRNGTASFLHKCKLENLLYYISFSVELAVGYNRRYRYCEAIHKTLLGHYHYWFQPHILIQEKRKPITMLLFRLRWYEIWCVFKFIISVTNAIQTVHAQCTAPRHPVPEKKNFPLNFDYPLPPAYNFLLAAGAQISHWLVIFCAPQTCEPVRQSLFEFVGGCLSAYELRDAIGLIGCSQIFKVCVVDANFCIR